MPDLAVPWGADELKISLPAHWQFQQVASASLRPAGADWLDRLAVAMNQPCAGEPLGKLLSARRAGRIVIIVEDATRHSPLEQILKTVMREIRHAGVADDQVEIFFAAGMHPPLTPDQAAEKLGPLSQQVRWRCNPWQRKDPYVCVGSVGKLAVEVDRGVATADLRIIVSSVSPHLQAGFGGGYKMLFPGCASLETIRGLHRLSLGRSARQLVGTDSQSNPMRATIDAAGQLVDAHAGRSFCVGYILDDDNLPSQIAAGEVAAAQQMLAKQCSAACGVVCGPPADVVITSAHPRDLDLWQCFKCIPNTLWAARPNGVIIALARSEAGLGGMNVPRWPLSAAWSRRLVRLLGPEALASLLMRLIPQLAGDAAFFVRLALQTLYRNTVFMVSPALHEVSLVFPGVEIFATVGEAVTAAEAVLGKGPQRVIVFPSGGITFPVLAKGSQAAPPQ